jgi:hypothetical protein
MTEAAIPTIPTGDIERYHAAAVELADEARRIVKPACTTGYGTWPRARY